LPSSLQVQSLPNCGRYSTDNIVLQLRYPNGVIALITYVANGDRRLGKERVEIHGAGRSAVLEDFRTLELVEMGRRHLTRSWLRQDKGHRDELAAFIRAVRRKQPAPISFAEILAATQITLRAVDCLRQGRNLADDSPL
jgi:predicted dehydrogenase